MEWALLIAVLGWLGIKRNPWRENILGTTFGWSKGTGIITVATGETLNGFTDAIVALPSRVALGRLIDVRVRGMMVTIDCGDLGPWYTEDDEYVVDGADVLADLVHNGDRSYATIARLQKQLPQHRTRWPKQEAGIDLTIGAWELFREVLTPEEWDRAQRGLLSLRMDWKFNDGSTQA